MVNAPAVLVGFNAVPELPVDPAVVTVALAVAFAASHFAGIPLHVAVVLIAAGVVVSSFISYKPSARTGEATPIQGAISRYFARLFRLAIGTAIIAAATVIALLAIR